MQPKFCIPRLPAEQKIGIYGGSFNPPHIGHMMAVLYAMAMHHLDQVWIIPCGEHPEGKKLLEFGHRYQMCKIAFTRIRNCRVLTLENSLPKPNLTSETLRFIREHEPKASLHLIVGQDCFNSIPKWEGGEDVMNQARLIGVPRSGFDSKGHLLPEISSTEIRASIKQNKSVERHLDSGVRQYIKENGLYVGEFETAEVKEVVQAGAHSD